MKCLVGLGNPGKKYEKNRHNIGFRFVDYFSKQNPKISEKIIFLKPQDYMNNSGIEVRKTMSFYKLSITDLLVVYDDLDLPFGEMRFRVKGSSGGHNGLKSIIAETGLDLFARIKIGIGRPEHKGQVTDHVLGDFSPDEEKMLPEILAKAYDKAMHWIENQE